MRWHSRQAAADRRRARRPTWKTGTGQSTSMTEEIDSFIPAGADKGGRSGRLHTDRRAHAKAPREPWRDQLHQLRTLFQHEHPHHEPRWPAGTELLLVLEPNAPGGPLRCALRPVTRTPRRKGGWTKPKTTPLGPVGLGSLPVPPDERALHRAPGRGDGPVRLRISAGVHADAAAGRRCAPRPVRGGPHRHRERRRPASPLVGRRAGLAVRTWRSVPPPVAATQIAGVLERGDARLCARTRWPYTATSSETGRGWPS